MVLGGKRRPYRKRDKEVKRFEEGSNEKEGNRLEGEDTRNSVN